MISLIKLISEIRKISSQKEWDFVQLKNYIQQYTNKNVSAAVDLEEFIEIWSEDQNFHWHTQSDIEQILREYDTTEEDIEGVLDMQEVRALERG